MAMFIVKPWYGKKNPDDYFDPVTHIATEENFIKFLQAGIYTSDVIGYKVQLSNSVDYNNGLWVIADVNHDSANTGQTDCYDLISEGSFYSTIFSSSNNSWRNSNPRTWLNNTFYPGFSTEFKNHVLNPKYYSQGTWYTDDKIILPSKVEVNGGTSGTDDVGIAYPIFTDNDSRIKKYNGSAIKWWTRFYITSGAFAGNVCFVMTNGGITEAAKTNRFYLAPLMRVS